MKKISILFLSLFVFAACSKDDDNAEQELTDLDALVALDQANPTNTMGWDQNEQDPSKWNGVTVKNGRVTSIVVEKEKGVKVLPEAISALTQLDSLIVPENGIEKLPAGIGKLTSLKKLDLFRNEISELPKEFSGLKGSLEYMRVSGELKVYPTVIYEFTSLEYLDLQGHGFKELPPEIGNLVNLKELKINSNELTTLPKEIGNLSKLERLDLFWNDDLESLPDEMGKLESLKRITISDNQDDFFPQSFKDLIDRNNISVFGISR